MRGMKPRMTVRGAAHDGEGWSARRKAKPRMTVKGGAVQTPSGDRRIAGTVSPTAQAGAKGGRMISASA
jgi:hypothetical protein